MSVEQAEKYIRKIRNPAKRDYAKRRLAWLLSGCNGPVPSRGELGGMAEQAVRWQLREYLPLLCERYT